MATIKAIEGRSVHQIQSGQVIVDLNSVVKELVENSLDAGATSIEVRFKNQGLDSVEVQDNGKGIAPEDFDTVALKHHTSKLSSYEDLASLDTFGFRGEALSSLCALSKFHVLTARVEDGAVGKSLDFEVSGKLKSTTVASAQKGTTVTVDELFYNLPVRWKELEKNVKREYGKVLSLLYAYACISVGVRFSVSNQMPKGKKVVAFSTKSNTTTKENIVNVFGSKTLLALTKLDLHLDIEPSRGPNTQGARNWATQATDRSMEVQIQGHISRPLFGEGRQAPDRQMFFVNSRPCQLPQVSKAINEVYKSFNVTQSPFIFANLIMDTNAYDVNVSPDKRTIMLHDQTALLESLKTALTEMFEQTDHTVPQSTLPNRKLPAYQPLKIVKQESTEDVSQTEDDAESDGDADALPEPDAVSFAIPAERNVSDVSNEEGPSLLNGWLGRDAEPRRDAPAAKKRGDDLPRDKQKLVDHMRKQSYATATNGGDPGTETSAAKGVRHGDATPFRPNAVAVQEIDEGVHEAAGGIHVAALKRDIVPDPMSTCYNDLFSQRPVQPMSSANSANGSIDHEDQLSDDESSHDAADLPAQAVAPSDIPAISPSTQKGTPGTVQSAFDRMRPRRTSPQTAEITVGEQTTTTTFGGTTMYKKRRVHVPETSRAIAAYGVSPLVTRGLRNFAAPDSQMGIDSSDMAAQANRKADSSNSESDSVDYAAPDMLPNSSRLQRIIVDDDDERTSDPLNELMPDAADDDEYDEDYLDERETRMRESERVARLIQDAEDAAARPTDSNLRRASQALKNGGNRKESTLQLTRVLSTSLAEIGRRAEALHQDMTAFLDSVNGVDTAVIKDELDDSNAESKLSLTVTKADFERMAIIGQFNLGFILAIRPAVGEADQDELFIIDQHAADEKYNYERLQRTVTIQSQRLVRPKVLELTAVEEEVILDNFEALKANGFEIEATSDLIDDDESSGRRLRLLTLPISGEKTFEMSDLDELLHLLSEAPTGCSEIPRPKKVQKILAMRACRSSIMVGKTLAVRQMQKVVTHMGEMEKPWNCPHGRPTMRHLAGLGAWNGWQEGDVLDGNEAEDSGAQVGRRTDWKAWLAERLILSISIITALGITILENPLIQAWLEEQRRKNAELLRSLSEDLDPESRRLAEAFAFEGKTPATHAGLEREASGSQDALAAATGRALAGSSSTVRRIAVSGPNDPDEAEERRRKGREYLARRNQQMVELQEKRKAAKNDETGTPSTPTSFDAIVDGEGKLKSTEPKDGTITLLDKELPSPPTIEPVPETVQEEMREVERHLAQPLLASESSSGLSGFHIGSTLANPFSDDFALDRSETPKPPVPAKVELHRETLETPTMPGSFTAQATEPQAEDPVMNHDELSYEEQLAIALSLSEAESSANGATVRQRRPEDQDAELKAAIEASLRDMDDQQAAHAIAHAEPVTPQSRSIQLEPLVDLTPPSPRIASVSPEAHRDWNAVFDYQALPPQDPLALRDPSVSENSDELYRITPQLTRARLASFDAQQYSLPLATPGNDLVHETPESQPLSLQPQLAMEASFYSAPSSASPLPDRSSGHSAADGALQDVRSPAAPGFESESDTEEFASLSRSASRAPSQARSEVSNIEVVDLEEDSDVDILSEEGNGVLTPDSWTEVGSRDGESDAGEIEHHSPA
ncbi:ATP-binding mismatch repair protein [Friedmanniomyces endolithicus]|uniref:DNA mismatch repair protein PMS1 n=1 Tax=Friedmanniomyces endolithicus TaxID=329885 RepID=A0AAN6R0Y7_9PEZI|nr:ATP-binding mismatch repair protein [Friedmanniomyces endolithicus]KAK0989475.1 ATP-binding mismatch repair protein [Friedmanniomyces endolithicus]KAK1011818.1 ATP-binding mismatch repair protein [Friedmanniomyces endolithicus]KAK1047004.1 ATP-binding mismatch repair protein [Friedmanniomyces endolithicus]